MSHEENADKRLAEVRRQLLARAFRPLANGKFGLPSYSHVEAWARGRVILYLVTSREDGGWDLLTSIDPSNVIDATWAAVDDLVAKDKEQEQ